MDLSALTAKELYGLTVFFPFSRIVLAQGPSSVLTERASVEADFTKRPDPVMASSSVGYQRSSR